MKVRAGTVQYDHLLQKKVPLCTDCNQQTCFAAPGASWPCQRPAWGRGEPRGWLKKKAEWKAMSGLIMGSYFFLKTQGVPEASCSHATSTDPRKGKTKQMDWTEARELSTLSQKWSSSAPLLHELPRSIKVTFSSFTSLTWCIFLSRVAISWGSFIFRISRSHPARILSLGLYFSFKLHFPRTWASSHLKRPLLFWWDPAFAHSSDRSCTSSRDALQEETVVGQRYQIWKTQIRFL